ncbi:hypothetical protein MMC10_000611 [Thelotrema lepadinum]|nr:hypothetical protein [Thelotrema lepadinum]
MLQTRRSALRAVKRLRLIPQRRFESSHGEDSHDSHSRDAHQHTGPVNEHLGRNFFIALTAIPVFAAAYRFSNSDPNAPPLFTRIIEAYSTYKEEWTTRNTLHTRAVEQAAFDRNLFLNERGAKMVDLKFPEVFNTGSPFNVPTSASVNLDKVIEHYREKNRKMTERVEKKTPEEKLAAS